MSPSREPDGRATPATRGPAILALLLLAAAVAALLIAPNLMPSSYDWVSHSTSESAAQGISGAWVARAGFLMFGAAVLTLTKAARDRWGRWGRRAHGAFGILMVGAAVFAARPWDESLPYDATEDLLHSIAAFGMGVCFALGVLAVMVRRPVGHIGRRVFDWVAFLAAPLLPLAMTLWPGVEGLLQRIMFGIALAWYATEAVDSLRAKPTPAMVAAD